MTISRGNASAPSAIRARVLRLDVRSASEAGRWTSPVLSTLSFLVAAAAARVCMTSATISKYLLSRKLVRAEPAPTPLQGTSLGL